MKHIYLTTALALAAVGCRPHQKIDGAKVLEGGGRPIGEFVGTPAIRQVFREQILDQQAATSKSFDVLSVAGKGIQENAKLLGAVADGGEQNEFRGGAPNPVGVLLWYKVFKIFSDAVGTSCGTDDRIITVGPVGTKVTLSPEFHGAVKSLCDAAVPPADREKAAAALWSIVAGDGAAAEGEVYAKATATLWSPESMPDAKARVSAMLVGAFMNPYFLLEHN